MFDTLLLRSSLHCNTPLHFTALPTLYHTSPNCTSLHLSTLHFLSFTLHYPIIQLYVFTFTIVLFHLTSLNQTQYNSHLQTYFQNYEPFHCPKELLNISLHFNPFFILFYFFTYLINPTLHFTLLYLQLTFLHFLPFIAFTSPHCFSLS